ncbi:MAG TPA: hypothetical protein VEV21_03485 [Burkholderiales bacterium]|jgi:ABC-type transport system involved in cytochrome c biogenesis permease component|nr:hypothetical protein [Burkholderiales bacterium]
MKTAGKFQRVSATIAALAMTFSIVWGISGYAYPDLSSGSLGQLAVTPSETAVNLPAHCKGCAPG